MQQPTGYEVPGKEHLVCKLKKSLYPRCWNKAFRVYMEEIGFSQGVADPCVYVHIIDTATVVAVHVDNLIVISASPDEMHEVKQSLADTFKMKDLGPLRYCLGVSIIQEEGCICGYIRSNTF